jgi:hypothetical protein
MTNLVRMRLLLYGIPLVFIGVTSLGRAAYSFRQDYHWTPGYRPLEEHQGKFEVYVRGELLDHTLQDGRLAARNGETWAALSSSDVTVRYNQIDRITRGPLLVGVGCLSAAFCWILAVLVLSKGNEMQQGEQSV